MVIIETVRMIPISTLELPDELWDVFGDGADFTFGDNNRTLVFPYRIANHIRSLVGACQDGGTWDDIADYLDSLEVEYPGVLIDLEN